MADEAAFAIFGSPHGPIHAAATDRGICALALRTTSEAFLGARRAFGAHDVTAIGRTSPRAARHRHLDRLEAELSAYWPGRRRSFDVPLDLNVRSGWDRRVLDVVRSIAYGQTLSYGGVAFRAGSRGAARAVGGAVGRNPIGLLVPCHRVIAGDGTLGGYGGSWFVDRDELLALKRALLAGEGVTVRP